MKKLSTVTDLVLDGLCKAAQLGDVPVPVRVLLAEAVKQAEQHALHGCDSDVYRSTIVDTLQRAIALRNTVWFRTRVIAKKTALVETLGGTLAWQEILGVYDPKKPDTLVAAANAGFSLWDTNGGAYGNQQRIELSANGKATIHTLDIESPDLRWNAAPTTWSYAGGKLSLGTGAVYILTWDPQYKTLFARVAGDDFPSFVAEQSECSA